MSQKAEAYAAYVRDWETNHPSVMQPLQHLSGHGSTESLDTLCVGMESVERHSRYLGGNSRYFKLANGQCVETQYVHQHGCMSRPHAVLWPSFEAAQSWCRPMSCNEYWHG